MSDSSLAFVLIHNHRFEANLDRIEKVYAGRFSRILHLMPFYKGDRANVISVSESSHYFHGFVAQASARLMAEECAHYVFCADDLILNPAINETNLAEILKLGPERGYIKDIRAFADIPFSWPHAAGALAAFERNSGVEWERELPSAHEAVLLFQKNGIETRPLKLRQLRSGVGPKQAVTLLFYILKRMQRKLRDRETEFFALPYPMANSYSDFFLIPRASFPRASHLMGIFAAMNLFAEVSIPMALLLSCQSVVQENATGWFGTELWDERAIKELRGRHNSNLNHLFAAFAPRELYIHPIKLSQWTLS